MNHRPKLRTGLCLLVCVFAAAAHGQVLLTGDEDLQFDRPESWVMKYFASLNLMTGFGPPQELGVGTVAIGFEADSVPSLSLEERTVGFNGTKEEDVNRTSVFGRPRVAVGLPRGFVLEGSYLPPIDISGVKPNLFALSLGREVGHWRQYRGGLRITGQYGTFTGDFTCSAEEIATGPNDFQCEAPSNDRIAIATASLEFSLARRARGDQGTEPYASLLLNVMELDFLVDADYQGLRDQTGLFTDGTTYAVALGLAGGSASRWRWAAEVFYSPLRVVRPASTSSENDALLNARVLISYHLRQAG